jgi:hypothetical protein
MTRERKTITTSGMTGYSTPRRNWPMFRIRTTADYGPESVIGRNVEVLLREQELLTIITNLAADEHYADVLERAVNARKRLLAEAASASTGILRRTDISNDLSGHIRRAMQGPPAT